MCIDYISGKPYPTKWLLLLLLLLVVDCCFRWCNVNCLVKRIGLPNYYEFFSLNLPFNFHCAYFFFHFFVRHKSVCNKSKNILLSHKLGIWFCGPKRTKKLMCKWRLKKNRSFSTVHSVQNECDSIIWSKETTSFKFVWFAMVVASIYGKYPRSDFQQNSFCTFLIRKSWRKTFEHKSVHKTFNYLNVYFRIDRSICVHIVNTWYAVNQPRSESERVKLTRPLVCAHP